jgi:hypothetical protein
MKNILSEVSVIVAGVWFAGLLLYLGKRFPPTSALAGKITEGYGA